MNRTQGSSNFSGVTSCGTSGARTCNIQRGQQDQNRVNMIYTMIYRIPNLERRYPTWKGDIFSRPSLWVSIEVLGYECDIYIYTIYFAMIFAKTSDTVII